MFFSASFEKESLLELITDKQFVSVPAVGTRTRTVLEVTALSESSLSVKEVDGYPKLRQIELTDASGKVVPEVSVVDASNGMPINALFIVAYSNEPADYAVLEGGWIPEGYEVVMPVGSAFNDVSDVVYVTPLMPAPLVSFNGQSVKVLFDGERPADSVKALVVNSKFVVSGETLSFRPVNIAGLTTPFVAFGFVDASNLDCSATPEECVGFYYVESETVEAMDAPVYLRLFRLVAEKKSVKVGAFWFIENEEEKGKIETSLPNFVL